MQRETELYEPVKALFEARGYEVKGEVGAVDMMARNNMGDVVLVELKLGFSLTLFHQATARLAISDQVYVAVRKPTGRMARSSLKNNLGLCRRLGIGLITVRERDRHVEVHLEPGSIAPRKSKKKQARLTKAFERLDGDPNDGGATRLGLVTGYRQDALKCAAYLAEYGASKGADVSLATNVPVATRLMADNHYGWFVRVSRGVYGLTDEGRAGLVHWAYSWGED